MNVVKNIMSYSITWKEMKIKLQHIQYFSVLFLCVNYTPVV